jgi:hypothetical protein
MKIGIDISQVVYKNTGVGRYVREMVKHLVSIDSENTYVLFGSSLRQRNVLKSFCDEIQKINPSVKTVIIPLPPTILNILWNRLHIIPITWFTGPLDIFWSSDWTQPPLGNARGMTTIHDLSFLRFPKSFDNTIISVQKRRLKAAKRECQHFLCDSQTTKIDVEQLLCIDSNRLSVVYPGYSDSFS